jgi:hypothetical protein
MSRSEPRIFAFGWLFVVLSTLVGCATVPAYDRGYLADPTMQPVVDPVADRSTRKLHQSREGASGGDANPAGGGCACSN